MPKGVPNPKPEAKVRDEEQEKREILFMRALRDILPSLKLFSDDQLKRKIGPEKLEDLALEFFGFLQAGAGELNQNEQLALANISLKALSKYINTRLNIPVTLKTILDSIGLLEYAVDIAFPGYFAAGLLKYSVRPFRQAV
jgi:hypothetical protein